MMNSRCFYTLNTAFNCLKALTATNVLDEITTRDHTVLNESLGKLALNPFLGTPQHKKAILSHMLNYPLNARCIYNLSKHADKIITEEPVGPCAHILTEFPICEALLDRYSSHITKVHATSDTIPVVMEGQKQPNYDFEITILIDKVMGLGQASTITKVLEGKDGGGIFKHSTRGSAGIITFDRDGKNIQTTPYVITEKHLLAHNKRRLEGLTLYLKNNGLYNHFRQTLIQCNVELDNINNGKSIFDINLAIENILWNNIQRDPIFPRSVSFVFLQKVDFQNHKTTFQERLMDSLNPQRNEFKPYCLDKKGDAKEFYISLLKAYYKEVDPQIYNKLLHLKHSGVKFNNYFNDILTSCIKDLL